MKTLWFLALFALGCEESTDLPAQTLAEPLTVQPEISLPWNELGLYQAAEDHLPFGPTALAANSESLWLLDQIDRQALKIGPKGIERKIPIPSGVEGIAIDGDDLWALSLINHRATQVSSKSGEIKEEVELPKWLQIDRLEARDGELLIYGSHQNTFSLGRENARFVWPGILHTQQKGLPGEGARFQTRLEEDGTASLVEVAEKGPGRPTSLVMPPMAGRLASATLLSMLPQNRAVIWAEWITADRTVLRALLLSDAKGQLLDYVQIEGDAFYFPRTEFSVVPTEDGALVVQLLPSASALRILSHRLRWSR